MIIFIKNNLIFFLNEKKTPKRIMTLTNCFLKGDGKITNLLIKSKPLPNTFISKDTYINSETCYCFHLFHNLSRETFYCEREKDYLDIVEKIKKEIVDNSKGSKTSIDQFHLVEYIGKGKFSVVHKAIDLRSQEHTYCAIKIIRKAKMENVDLISTRREIDIMKQLNNCDNVVKYIDYCENYEYIYIIEEFINSITLNQFLKKNDYFLREEVVKAILRQCLSVIDHAHQLGIIHRDMKPDNILISEGDYKITIIDYGLGRFLGANQLVVNEPFGTLVFL